MLKNPCAVPKRLAGWLDKLTGDKKQKGGASKGLGGLFKSLKVPNQGQSAAGMQSVAGTQSESGPQAASTAFMDFMCTDHKKTWAYEFPAPDTTLVAGDFKVPVAELPAIFKKGFSKVKYAAVPNPQNFKDSFDSPKVKELFLKFLSEKSPEVLSQFKKLSQKSSSSSRGIKEQADASFGYGLILLHYSDFVSDASTPLRYLKKAWKDGQRGANYVWGALIFYGEAGLRRDVNVAANFVANANAGDAQDNQGGQEETDSEPFQPFAPAAALLIKISKDPAFKYKGMYASLQKDAENFKRKWISKRNTGSALYRKATQLNYQSVLPLGALAKALDLGDKYNEVVAEMRFISQEQDQTQQLVERSLRIKEGFDKLILDELNKKKTLDAEQIVAVEKTEAANRIIGYKFFTVQNQFLMGFMASGGAINPGLVTDMAVMTGAMQGGIDASCKVRKDLKLAYQTKQEGNKTLAETAPSKEAIDKANEDLKDLDDD